MLRGNVDIATLYEVAGWAHDEDQPNEPVSLLVTDNDKLIGRILANRFRADLKEAGIGEGQHSFEFKFPQSLPPSEKHVLRIRREIDGIDLAPSPITIEPSDAFDKEIQRSLDEIIQRTGSGKDISKKIDFLVDEIETLLEKLGNLDGQKIDRDRYRQYLRRWGRTPQDGGALGVSSNSKGIPRRRALIIDDRLPQSDRDAASVAILSHILSLQRLGFETVFTPSIEFASTSENVAKFDAIGVTCCQSPFYSSIEDVLRRQAGEFDVVYMHRVSNVAKYGELVRFYNPKARRIFSVADLHHVRLERQAAIEDRPELVARSRWMQLIEYVAAVSADIVITHSTIEAAALAKQIPKSKIHTIGWAVTPKPTKVSFTKRRGVAFIGGYSHAPNLDAAKWLISEIMPLVRKQDPTIECLLVGSNMPDGLRELCGDGVVAIGHVPDLAEIFDRVRVTVAPLTFGAGIKGKVIESLAAGVPCICTPVAAEGLEFPEMLRSNISESATGLSELICRLHRDKSANAKSRQAGLDYVASAFSADRLDSAMRQALGFGAQI